LVETLRLAAAIFRFTSAHRRAVLALLLALTAMSAVVATCIGIDMSFQPTFSTERGLVDDTERREVVYNTMKQ